MKIKRILSILLIVTMLMGLANVNIFAATTAGIKYEISVAVDPAHTTINLDTFEADLKAKLVSQLASKGKTITANDIKISYVQPNTIKTTDQGAWNIYDHYYSPAYESSSKTTQDQTNLLNLAGRVGQPFYYYREGVPTNTTSFFTSPDVGNTSIFFRDKHIYAEGSRMTFMGYSAPAYNDFMFFPDTNSGKKTIEYSVYLSGVNNHTLAGAGFLVNSKITGTGSSAVINGYLVYYNYASFNTSTYQNDIIYLYKLTNVNVESLHQGQIAIGGSGISVVGSVNGLSPKVEGKSVKDIKLVVSSSSIDFYEKDGTSTSASYESVFTYSIPLIDKSTDYGFGPLVAYNSHGCSQLTIYTYDNLKMTSNNTKNFDQKILDTKWTDGAVHALVNVDDSGIVNFGDNNARTEMLQRLLKRNVHYIGWGAYDKTQALSFINDNNDQGMNIDTSTATNNVTDGAGTTTTAANYSAQVDAIAAYLAGLIDSEIDQVPVAKIDYDGSSLSGESSTDPNGDNLTEHWSVKEAGDANWTTATDASDAYSKLQTLLGSTNKNVLVQLIVEDTHGNFSEPDVLYLSTQANVKPIAEFDIAESIDLESGNTTVAPDNTSFDPAYPARTMTYQWKVYNEMGKLVQTYSGDKPNMDFGGLASGRYDIKLTAMAEGIDSNTYVQSLKLVDTIAPKLLIGLQGTKDNATATIQIVDEGSGPDSYRVITKNTSDVQITGPWVPAAAVRTITKTYSFVPTQLKTLTFEVKDGSGNTKSYPVDFAVPMIAYTPNGGDIYTNFTYDQDVKVDISSLSADTITDWYYQWTTSSTYPEDGDIKTDGTHVEGAVSASIPQPNEVGNYYLHVLAVNSANKEAVAVSELFNVAVARNGVRDFRITSFDSNGAAFAWTVPAGATAQKILYSTDNEHWVQATHAALNGSSSTALVTGLNSTIEYAFKLLVTGGEDAGASNLAYWKNLITYAAGDNAASVTKSINLAKTAGQGTTVNWSSNHPSFVDTLGNVYRPTMTQGDQTVILTATINNGGSTMTISYSLTVKALPMTDIEAVAFDKASLAIGYAGSDSAQSVTQNVSLPTTLSNGSTVAWVSDTTDTIGITSNDTVGAVTRPAFEVGNKNVVLTATIEKNGVQETKKFELTVIKTNTLSDEAAVAADQAALEILYATGDSADYVTRAVKLPDTASNGSSVTWSSNSSSIAVGDSTTNHFYDGTVTRPAFEDVDATVTLTATITKGMESITKDFVLTVKKNAESENADAAEADEDAYSLVIGYQGDDNANHVTRDIILPNTTSNGSTVTWNSNDIVVIKVDGTVSRPDNDKIVVLTVTIVKNEVEVERTFTLNVIAQEPDYSEDVDAAKDSLEITYADGDSANSVTQNVILPLTAGNGTTVAWISEDSSAVDAMGNIFRPGMGQENKTVTLTATIRKGDTTRTKSFTIKIKALDADTTNDINALAADKAALSIGYASGDSASSVTQNVTLADTTANGFTVSWTSDKSNIAADGKVTRPAAGSSDQQVVLTATLTKGELTDQKVFDLLVKANVRVIIVDREEPAPTPTKEVITVDVKGNSGDTVSNAVVERTTSSDGKKKDTVTYEENKAKEAVDKLKAANETTAKIVIPDKKDEVGEVEVKLTKGSIAAFANSKINLEMYTDNGRIIIPQDSLQGINQDLYFRVVPIKEQAKRTQVEQQVAKDQLTLEIAAGRTVSLVERPSTIETNMSSKPVTIVLPLREAKLPTAAAARASYLKNLFVYIEHHDGEKEILRGTLVDYDESGTSGLEFGINKFSTFAIAYMASEVLEFKLPGLVGDADIDYLNGIIKVNVDENTDITKLPATFELSEGATVTVNGVKQVSGVTLNDYTKPVTFVVTGADGTVKTWTVILTKVKGAAIGGHKAYINGYVDGTMKPDNNITRAEMAAILYRILKDDLGAAKGKTWPDVKNNYWAKESIENVTGWGIMVGLPDGSFSPNGLLTRAEMATIISRWTKLTDRGTSSLTDIKGHWAQADIEKSAKAGYMIGYLDSSFKPNKNITRAEVVTTVNRVLKRGPLYGVTKPSWPDVAASYWAFKDIEEASKDHSYTMTPEGTEMKK